MKTKIIFVALFTVLVTLSASGQMLLPDGDAYFKKGDYQCALTKYQEAYKADDGSLKQIIQEKINQAKLCLDYVDAADKAFAIKNYINAKDSYQKLLEANPNDSRAKSRLSEIVKLQLNEIIKMGDAFLETGSYAFAQRKYEEALSLADGLEKQSIERKITQTENSLKYATIADDLFWQKEYADAIKNYQEILKINSTDVYAAAQIKRSNDILNPPTTLIVSKNRVSFTASGGKETVTVSTNARSYSISGLPSWCKVKKSSNSFTITCDANKGYGRSESLIISADDKTSYVFLAQERYSAPLTKSSRRKSQQNYSSYKPSNCFNCPKTKNVYGLSLGYLQSNEEFFEGYQIGFRIEPLFKYGFGLTTGINLEGYKFINSDEFNLYSINIPFHLQYRLNFSKWFNVFAYGGAGLNFVTKEFYNDEARIIASLEFGGGVRVNRLQLTIGQSQFLKKLGSEELSDQWLYNKTCEKWGITLSYMF